MAFTYTYVKDLDKRQKLYGTCKDCHRETVLDRLDPELKLDDLVKRLKCAGCGSRNCGYQIVYTYGQLIGI